MKPCPACAEEIQDSAVKCRHCGEMLDGSAPARGGGGDGGGVQTLIPTGNPPALLAYYLAVFSLIPCAGLALGPGAVVLGLVGLSKIKKDPRLSGKAHAWVGIVLGGLTGLANGALILAPVIARAVR